MKQEFTAAGDRVEVTLSGSLHVEDAAGMREKLLEYIDGGATTFVINLRAVDYIDSSGLGVLVAVQKRALQKGGEVVLVGANGLVREIIELTRLNKVFSMK